MSGIGVQDLQNWSDAELVEASKCGQLKAFAELVERTQGLARAVAYSASGEASSVEDLVQEALVTAWTRLADLSKPAAFRPWLAGIVRNTARYWRRHHGRHAPRAQAGMDSLVNLASAAPSPLEEVQWIEDWNHTSAALEELPDKYREPLVLYYSLGESHAEVAQALGLSEASARQRVHRARKRLASELEGVERGGKRLAARASAAAGILIVIQKRQAMAASPLPAAPLAATASPKLFLAAGALGGGALVACIVAFAMLVVGEGESMGRSTPHEPASTTQATPPQSPVPQGERRPGFEEEGLAPAKESFDLVELADRVSAAEGLVSMGKGKVGDKNESDTAYKNFTERSIEARGGRIEKHGPAILHEEEKKPLMRPDIDMRAVKREFWQ